MSVHASRQEIRPSERVVNAFVRWLADRGIGIAGARSLTVTGRRTGAPHRVPVNPLRVKSGLYLLAPRGETDWVRNVRVHPQAQLRRGRIISEVVLSEVSDADLKTAVIIGYLQRWGWEVAGLLPDGITAGADEQTVRSHLDALPVFQVQAPGASSGPGPSRASIGWHGGPAR